MTMLDSVTDGTRHPDEDADYDDFDRAVNKLEALQLARDMRDSDNPILQRGYRVFLAALDIAMAQEKLPILNIKRSQFDGRLLYSYDAAYWWSSAEKAAEAYRYIYRRNHD